MIITLKTLLQQTFTVDVDESLTIKELKKRVHEERGADFPAESLNLIYSGVIMKDEEQIKDYKIDSKKFIVVMKKKEKVEAPAQPTTSTAPAKPADSSSGEPAKKVDEKKPAETAADSSGSTESTVVAAAAGQSDNEEVIGNMMELGYPRRLVEAALRLSYNNPNVACEYLISERITEANMDSVEADGLALGTARDDLMDLVDAFGSSRNQAGGNPENEPLAFLRAQPQFHQMRQQIQENPQFLNTVLQQIGVNNPGLLKLISENQTAFVNMINEPLNNNNNNNNRNVASGQPAAASLTGVTPPVSTEPMEVVQEGSAQPSRSLDLTANDDLLAATLASQIADDEDDDAEGQQPSSQQQQPGVQAGAESDSNILGSLPQLSENDRAAIRRIQEVSGFSEIEVIQAYIACGKNEDLAADFLFTE